jgi:hypothetical protein
MLRARLLLVLQLGFGSAAWCAADSATGLIVAPGFEQVRTQCTVCHSARLITQNRASRDGWLQMIRWMQESQGLWPLGDNETPILNYLAENYAPASSGRRKPLQVTFD